MKKTYTYSIRPTRNHVNKKRVGKIFKVLKEKKTTNKNSTQLKKLHINMKQK